MEIWTVGFRRHTNLHLCGWWQINSHTLVSDGTRVPAGTFDSKTSSFNNIYPKYFVFEKFEGLSQLESLLELRCIPPPSGFFSDSEAFGSQILGIKLTTGSFLPGIATACRFFLPPNSPPVWRYGDLKTPFYMGVRILLHQTAVLIHPPETPREFPLNIDPMFADKIFGCKWCCKHHLFCT